MKFTYCYKSSDGVRHEEKIEASSRDAVFELLRKQGIRPIKVVAADGSKANGAPRVIFSKRIAALALLTGAIVGIVLMHTASRVDLRDRRIAELDKSAQAVFKDHEARMASANWTGKLDFAGLSDVNGAAAFRRTIAQAYRELNTTRQKLREIFGAIYSTLPEGQIRDDANALFNAAMDRVDLAESKVVQAEKKYHFRRPSFRLAFREWPCRMERCLARSRIRRIHP